MTIPSRSCRSGCHSTHGTANTVSSLGDWRRECVFALSPTRWLGSDLLDVDRLIKAYAPLQSVPWQLRHRCAADLIALQTLLVATLSILFCVLGDIDHLGDGHCVEVAECLQRCQPNSCLHFEDTRPACTVRWMLGREIWSFSHSKPEYPT